MESVKDISVPIEENPQDFEFVSFEVAREEWNKYKVEDGSTLKMKFVLINVTMEKGYKEIIDRAKTEKGLKLRFGFQSQNVTGVEAPMALRGSADKKTYTIEELRSSIIQEELDFKVVEETWNIYKLKNEFTIKVRNTPISINRTSKFDYMGLPVYLVDSAVDVKFLSPKK